MLELFTLILATAVLPRPARADPYDAPAAEVRMRFDSIFRGLPRYVLTAQDRVATSDDRYWRSITMAPLQHRAAVDATNLLGGYVDAHLSAWGAVDLANPTASDGRVSGDLAVAWVALRRGPASVWLGRRFMPWGAPGGVHLDGIGAEARFANGLSMEAIAGRPVTPTYGAMTGARPGFDGAAFASGARIGWTRQGLLATSMSFVEHWAEGIPVRRVVESSLVASPTRWLDARASISWDLLGFGVMQADLDVTVWLGRTLVVDLGAGHLNPALLIPRWSILSVFVTRTFDEARGRVTWRSLPGVQIGLEAAAQHYEIPGGPAPLDAPPWGSRVELFVRIHSPDRRGQAIATVSHRDDGAHRMLFVRIAGSYQLFPQVFAALEGATALDEDDPSAPRTSFFGRASLDGAIAQGWRAGGSVDVVRSSTVESELRGMLHVTAQLDVRAGALR